MRTHHLGILGLDNTATEAEIRSAYRRLSKQLHPDVNKAPDAGERFIAINNAYEYLMANNAAEVTTSDHDDEHLSDIEKWRIQAKQKAKQKARERELYKQQLMDKIVRALSFAVAAIGLFNFALALDYLLPRNISSKDLLKVEKIWKPSGRSGILVYRYDDYHFTDYVVRVSKRAVSVAPPYEKSEVHATPIFAKPIKMILFKAGNHYEYPQLYNVFVLFGYIIPALLVLCLLFFIIRKPLHRLNIAMIMIIIEPVQLVIFFSL